MKTVPGTLLNHAFLIIATNILMKRLPTDPNGTIVAMGTPELSDMKC